jgi:predicted house-cleaning noncanonical NTP pyrophosphatase (MazG superfamily)
MDVISTQIMKGTICSMECKTIQRIHYKKKLSEEYAEELQKKKIEDLAFYMDILRERLTRMLKVAMDTRRT